MDAGLHRVEHVAAGQIDGRRPIKIQIDVGPLSGNNRLNDIHDVATCQKVGFQPLGGNAIARGDVQTGLGSHDLGIDDDRRSHLSEVHADQAGHADFGSRREGLDPHGAEGQERNDRAQRQQAEQHQ